MPDSGKAIASPSTDKLSASLLLLFFVIILMEQANSVIVLPPYWFDIQNPQYQSFYDRLVELEKLRDTINDEINYLKSILAEAT
jgi:hypothetical protein